MSDLNVTYKLAIGPSLAEKIPPGSSYWSEFNGAFTNKELPQPAIVSQIAAGHTFTTWHSDNWRHSRNYLMGQHIGIDFDTEDERSSIDYLLADPFIRKYGSLLYTTPSHTREAPRARVVFLLDHPIHQAKNYVLAASSLLWLFGTADRQCKDAVRFFYGGSPDGRVEWPANVLPLAIVKDLIGRYKATGMREKRTVERTYKAQTTDEREVQEALKHIPPWGVEYQEWVSILMAIHSEFPGPNGLAMAESWGQGYEGEVPRKWRSFDRNGNGTGRVSLGTLFKIAQEHGYSGVSA